MTQVPFSCLNWIHYTLSCLSCSFCEEAFSQSMWIIKLVPRVKRQWRWTSLIYMHIPSTLSVYEQVYWLFNQLSSQEDALCMMCIPVGTREVAYNTMINWSYHNKTVWQQMNSGHNYVVIFLNIKVFNHILWNGSSKKTLFRLISMLNLIISTSYLH